MRCIVGKALLRVRYVTILALASAPLFVPMFRAHAEYGQSNQQCPSGGVVGQECKDSTNGFVTQGHCTHINECAADQWPKAPSGAQQKQPSASAASTAYTPPSATTQATPDGPTAPSNLRSDIINSAYDSGDAPDTSGGEQLPENIVSIDGVLYAIAGNEKLRFGDALTDTAPPDAAGAPDPNGLGDISSLKAAYGPGAQGKDVGDAANGGPADTFAGPISGTGEHSNRSLADISAEYIPAFAPLGVAILAALGAVAYVFTRGGRRSFDELKFDAEQHAKELTTKDSSVATPIMTGVQEKPIWDSHPMPGDERTGPVV